MRLTPNPCGQEYHGTVTQVVLGADYAAVRVEGQILLHPYDPQQQVPAGREDKRFPEKQGEKVTHMVSPETMTETRASNNC